MVDYRIPLYKRLENVKAKRPHANNVPESPGIGYNGEGRHRKPVWVGSQKWFATNWRNLKYADDVKDAGIRHQGWFTNEFQDETIRGAIVQLPSGRKGEERWLAGYEDAGENYVFYLDVHDSEEDAARMADEHARVCAENEQEYNAKWQAKRAREDATEELAGHVESFRELWNLRHCEGPAPIMETVWESLRSHLEDIRELREKIEKSVNDWGDLEDVD